MGTHTYNAEHITPMKTITQKNLIGFSILI